MKPYRIAVCLSGQPRTWKTCVSSIKGFFEPAGQVDYFISTWDHDSWFRNKKLVIEPSDTDGLQEAYGAISVNVSPLPTAKGWYGLFNSMERSIHDKKTHEIANLFSYDVVVKGRLDCVFAPGTTFNPGHIEPMTAYAVNRMERMPHEFYGANFSDMWFHSGSAEMDIIGSCIRDLSPEDHWDMGPGVLLWRHMTRFGIHPNFSPALVRNTVVRESVSHLDPQTSYEEMHRTFHNWAER